MSVFKRRLFTFLLSMTPISECKVAVAFSMANGASIPEALIISIIGNCLVIAPVILLFNNLLYAMRKARATAHIANFLERRAVKKSKKVENSWFLGLLIFVAIPLPGGAWTAAMVAGLLQMRLRKAIIPIAIGVIISGTIVAFATYFLLKEQLLQSA